MKNKYRKIKLPNGTTRDEHRLIMEEYLGRKLSRHEVVHHRNEDRSDNRLENLELMSLSDHGHFHHKGRRRTEDEIAKIRGENSSSAKLTEQDVFEIRRCISKGEKLTEIAKRYGVKRPAISKIKHRRNWTHI